MLQWRIVDGMVIKETQFFTEIIPKLISDDHYAKLQEAIILQPNVGAIIAKL